MASIPEVGESGDHNSQNNNSITNTSIQFNGCPISGVLFCCDFFVLIFWFFFYYFCSSSSVHAQVTSNDVYSVSYNFPTCLPVTNNDQPGVTLIWSSNGTNGFTYRNKPPAFWAGTYSVVIDAENAHVKNAGNTTLSGFVNTSSTWVFTTNTSAGGSAAMINSPNNGYSSGDSLWGPALVFNVYFQSNGTYRIWVRGKASVSANDDSIHALYLDPGSSSLVWLTNSVNDRLYLYNISNFQWQGTKRTLNITNATWPPKMWQIWLGQREDGFVVDQLLVTCLSGANYSSVTYSYSQSSEISCGSNEIMYIPKYGFSGVDSFSYQAKNASSSVGTSTVTVYVNTPVPSPSITPTPSRTPSTTPSTTPSRTATPSVTPSLTPTPSKTPSPTSSPSINSSPSSSPSITPSTSRTPSVTPSSSPSATSSPSVTPTSSVTPSGSPSPTSSTTPSVTPSVTPNPLTCVSISPGPAFTTFALTNSSTSNFGQTFRPFAPGLLTSLSIWRSDYDTTYVTATFTLLQGIATDSESGLTLTSFTTTLYSGMQTFNLFPPIRLEDTRYEFLLDTASDTANMVIADTVLVNQYCIQDQQISSVTAAFDYCLVPDFFPSPTPSASPSQAVVSVSPTESPEPQEGSKERKGLNFVLIGAAGGGGLLLLSAVIAAFVIRSKTRKNNKPDDKNLPSNSNDVEMHQAQAQTGNYHPIGTLTQSVPNSTAPSGPTSYEGQNWNIPYSELSLEEEIGRGAFGVVYKGTWQGVHVADANLTSDLRIQDFFAEAELMKKLRAHPNVTQLLGTCFSPLCIVIEYVDNGSLWSWLDGKKPMDEGMQVSIARGIAAGMLYLHSEGIIHRDLAARNILLDSKMSPKVSDFGMSRVAFENKTNKTASEIGPIRWMAPEAMRQRLYNKKTDMWSYGAVLYEIMTRKMPFHQYDLVHVATSVSLKELSLVPEIKEDAPKFNYSTVLVRIMEKCMDFEPEKRPLFENVVQMFDEQLSNQSITKMTQPNQNYNQQTEYRTHYSKVTMDQE